MERRPRANKRHIRKQQYQQQRGQQYRVAVTECPNKCLRDLHGSTIFMRELNRFIREQKAKDKSERKRDYNSRIFTPLSEVIVGY
jgi:hypothetical protein